MDELITLQITLRQKHIIGSGLVAHSENLAKRIGYAVLYPDDESQSMDHLKMRHKEINDLIEIISKA